MKNAKTIFLILLVLLNFISCSKEDDPINQPPGAFTVTPVVSTDFVKLSWTEAVDPEEGVVTYTIILDEKTIVSNLNQRNYEFSGLEYSKNFTGKIVAYDSEGLTSQSSFNFETEVRPNTAPTAPSLAQAKGLKPKLSWKPAQDAENDTIVYDVYLDKSSNPSTKIAENLSGTTYEVKNALDAESTYWWRVVARDAFNAETSSSIGKFATPSLVKAVLVNDSPGFKDTYGHTSEVFDGAMWIIGGQRIGGSRLNNVYYSKDGVEWTETSNEKRFTARSAHASAVIDNKIWITGGNNGAGVEFNDVWSSEDGETWQQVNDKAAFSKRYGHKMIVFDGKLWILGGRNIANSISRNQVWNSTDGKNWKEITNDAGISFQDSEFIVRDNKIWRIGNYHTAETFSSVDGKTWVLEGENVPFGRRIKHTVVQHDDKIWVISGSDVAVNKNVEISDVWYSEDGKTWKLASKDAGYKAVAHHTSEVYDNKIWIIAGSGGNGSNFITNDIWRLEY